MHELHEHIHEHGHEHDHEHDHTEAEETAALLHYMLHHNEHHAEELKDMAFSLNTQGKKEASALISEAVKAFEEGNEKLQKAFALLGE